jgi:hypothetical protein
MFLIILSAIVILLSIFYALTWLNNLLLTLVQVSDVVSCVIVRNSGECFWWTIFVLFLDLEESRDGRFLIIFQWFEQKGL